MKGNPEVIDYLNQQLTCELTAINQFFLESKLQDNLGYTKLAKKTREESFEEMKHAEILTDRIILLDGLPNYQRLGHVRIGQTIKEMYEADLELEKEAVAILRPGVVAMRKADDHVSARLFESILKDEEEHVDYLETQLGLIDKLGEQLYAATLTASLPD
ncbi:bacterioferritin [Mangrovactinospora gilvigrisea]|uniref:Bacterioferritin n=1 Tax=Mangrovactinospora gilvigrisea TaxID=1428644 RepID=A0A1J7BC26_9ACTN|nr:bacterioferritin [Mangrovactinospora gilvigrisea]OIV36247.1 bacterioferritin [Mangrovactinospora gilvigrisea]